MNKLTNTYMYPKISRVVGLFLFVAFAAIFFNFGYVQITPQGDLSLFSVNSEACCDGGGLDGGGGGGGGDDPVIPEDPGVNVFPACTLEVEDATLEEDQSTTLTWFSSDATEGRINQGIGSVSPVKQGSVTITPSTSTTYVGTFEGENKLVTCSVKVTVTPPPPPPEKECKLTITKSVDQASVTPGDVVEYRLDFKNTGDAKCTGSGVKVIDVLDSRLEYLSEKHSADVTAGYMSEPVYTASTRTLVWNAWDLDPNETGWVTFKTKVATPTQCSENIPNKGKITSFEYNNFTTFVESNTVNVEVKRSCGPHNPVPVCTLSSNPSSFQTSGTTTLSWTSANVTSGSIDQGIGSISPVSMGTTSVFVATTTTYIATFTGSYGTVSCNTTVTVTPPPSGHGPRCEMRISKGQIPRGDSAELSWTSVNVNNLTIDQGIGATTTVNGKIIVSPNDNTTYTGVFTGPHGNVTCQASITVTTGGGGCIGSCGSTQQPPTVVLYQKPTSQPLAFVSLTQIPYTGFEAGPFVTGLFYLLLALFSAGVAYAMVFRNAWAYILPAGFLGSTATSGQKPEVSVTHASQPSHGSPQHAFEARTGHTRAEAPTHLLGFTPQGVSERDFVEPVLLPQNEFERNVEERLFAERILVSKSGMRRVGNAGRTPEESKEILDRVIYLAKRNYPREDGWILLSDERVEDVFLQMAPKETEIKKTVTGETRASTTALALVSWILDGEKDKLFGLLRSLATQGRTMEELLTDAVVILDRAYRARIEGGAALDASLAARLNALSPKQIEELVQALSGAIDQSYSSPVVGAKLAIAQTLNLVSKWKQGVEQGVRSPFVDAKN